MATKKILVIEDNADNLQLVRILLENSGYQVLTAIDGATGLQLAVESLPDLVLLDLDIPEMNGWEVAKNLKQNQGTQDIPLVALTALTNVEDKKRAKDAGFQGYITKPIVDVSKFSGVVKSFLAA